MSARPEAQHSPDTPDVARPRVLVRRLHAAATLPAYALPGDAGADLSCVEDVLLAPGERALVATGVALAIPDGWVGLVHPRSGLAARHGLSIVNAPGTIDSGYRGEILINLINTDATTPVHLRAGDRIAQLLLQQVGAAHFAEVDSLPESTRGETGHGSTGGFGATSPASATPSTKDPS
jgi:dUTP pyrophosphatase